jgi:uncharacterized membrane protein YcaP (DUF421 family)
LSENTKSQVEEDFQNFELNSKEQSEENNTNCQKLREQNEHAHEDNFFQKQLKQI